MATLHEAARGFHLGLGGPFHRVERATRLRLGELILASIAITWVPLVMLSLAQQASSGAIPPLLRELSIHARCLVAIPLFLVAERQLDRACAVAVSRLFSEGFVRPHDRLTLRATLQRLESWVESPWPEALLLLLAIGVSAGRWFGVVHEPGIEHVESWRGAPAAWYALVSLPLCQFLLWRSLFRWLLWSRLLFTLSRLDLNLHPTHPDRRAGLAFLKLPSLAYCLLLLLAVSSVLCGAWTTEILTYGTRLSAFKSLFYVFVFVGTLVAFGPLLFFVPSLLAARRRGEIAFGALAGDYSAQFEARWLSGRPRGNMLGDPSPQTLADIGNSYRESVEKLQPLLFGVRDVIALFVVAQLPAMPLILTRVPARETLLHLLHLLTG